MEQQVNLYQPILGAEKRLFSARAIGVGLVLLSEGFQHGMVFGRVTVRNPFVSGVEESRAAYQVPVVPRPRHRGRGRPASAA